MTGRDCFMVIKPYIDRDSVSLYPMWSMPKDTGSSKSLTLYNESLCKDPINAVYDSASTHASPQDGDMDVLPRFMDMTLLSQVINMSVLPRVRDYITVLPLPP